MSILQLIPVTMPSNITMNVQESNQPNEMTFSFDRSALGACFRLKPSEERRRLSRTQQGAVRSISISSMWFAGVRERSTLRVIATWQDAVEEFAEETLNMITWTAERGKKGWRSKQLRWVGRYEERQAARSIENAKAKRDTNIKGFTSLWEPIFLLATWHNNFG